MDSQLGGITTKDNVMKEPSMTVATLYVVFVRVLNFGLSIQLVEL